MLICAKYLAPNIFNVCMFNSAKHVIFFTPLSVNLLLFYHPIGRNATLSSFKHTWMLELDTHSSIIAIMFKMICFYRSFQLPGKCFLLNNFTCNHIKLLYRSGFVLRDNTDGGAHKYNCARRAISF